MLGRDIVLFHTFTVLVFAVGHEGLRVHGPSGPLVAQLGGSVLLPCFIESPPPLEDLQVEWRKMDSDSLVSLFQQGKSRPDLQSQLFRGRVDFFPDEVLQGNYSILLRNVAEEDSGVYRCKVNTNQESSEVIMEITDIKYFMVTGADRAIYAHEGEDVILSCSVDSHVPASEIEEVTWKRNDGDQDILVLLYQDSEIFPDSSHEHYQGRVDLFSSEIHKGNFSLKLSDVQIEDKGEFICEVHAKNISGRTIVVLQGVGFSALHILILVFCLIALLLAIGFCAPVFNLLRMKVTTKKGMKIHISLILCPNICMFVAFCLWSTEGILSEVITCSVVSIMRPLMLMKTSPYLERLPQFFQKGVKALAFPLYHSSIVMSACSVFFSAGIQTRTEQTDTILTFLAVGLVISILVLAVFGLRIHLTMYLEALNSILTALSLSGSRARLDYNLEVNMVVPPLNAAMLLVLSLQRHLFLGKPFERVHIAASSLFMTSFSLFEIVIYITHSNRINDFIRGWILIFEVVISVFAWIVLVVYLLRCHRGQKQGCCSQWRTIGYLCCTVIAAFLITTFGAMCFRYSYIMDRKDRAGYLAVTPLVHVLAATCLFKHPKYLPGFLHIMVYMFGAVVLSTVDAIVLATELILKAGKGTRTIEDLRVIVLPVETLFLFAWLALQIYDAWMRLKDRTKRNFEDERRAGPEVVPEVEEMEVLSDANPNPD